jgi:DMSO/TMAO reductase YedYZ molybdopterin-dependent catalytic subunit
MSAGKFCDTNRYPIPVTEQTMISRRTFLSLTAAALLPRQSQPGMIVRSARPEDLEMPLTGFNNLITPVEQFFVRSHMSVPRINRSDWRLKVEGHVSSPLTLTLEDLQTMQSFEVISVLECAGNGRAFFEPPVAGLQWRHGAVGNARWRGVRLADVLKRAGVKDGAVEVLFDGADTPIGAMADFQRSVPMPKALDQNTLLAYAMNNGPLTAPHGFPLRAVIPGWAGDHWTKWVTNVRVLNEPFTGYWMKSAYLYPKQPAAPGSVVAADAMTPVTSLRVKSVIASPDDGSSVEPGKPLIVRGVAWSGDKGAVTAVDVSVDRGRSWRAARLIGAATSFGFRIWEFPWTPSHDGYQTVLARARDASGDVQPMAPEWNPSGYLWNGIARAEYNTLPKESNTAALPPLPPQPPPVFNQSCLICHGDDVIRQQRLTRAQWDREITKMTNWGARVEAADRDALLDFLSRIR